MLLKEDLSYDLVVKLSVTAPTLSKTKVKGGDLVTFATNVTNLGASGVQNVTVLFLLDGTQLGSTRTITSLAPGAQATVKEDCDPYRR